ncbi:MAG: endo-1,4-beta-xylanase [Oscillospiraceae bacterium]|nr:endo-1,4-beta-xylanase [Oscillospiraceae bacterium]
MRRRVLTLALAAALVLALVPTVAANEGTGGLFIDFESGGLNGFAGNGSTLTVTNEQSHSGNNSLLVSNREGFWHWAEVRVDHLIEPDVVYEISAWVLSKGEEEYYFNLFTQISEGEDSQYRWIDGSDLSKSNGWTKFSGQFVYTPDDLTGGYITIYVYSNDPNVEYYIDDISFRIDPNTANIAATTRLPSLQELYKDHFLIGNIFDVWSLPMRLPILKRHYNIVTAEGAMKPGVLTSASGVYDFFDIDNALGIFLEEGMVVHGHTLVWEQTHADWLTNNPDGTPLTRTEAKANLETYISTVAGHFSGKVVSWDVLNEAYAAWENDFPEKTASDWRNGLKTYSPWYQAFSNGANDGESGADYIEYAFRLARAADPNATLYYNADFAEGQAHITAVAAMVKEINDKWLAEGNSRLLIEGVGLQGHFQINVNLADVERNISHLANLGVEISISELDISIFDWVPWQGAPTEELIPTQALFEKQAEVYAKLFQMFKRYSNHIEFVTFWGLSDGASWISTNYPTIFSADFTPKLAYFAVADPEGYLAGNYDTEAKRQAWIQANSLAPNLSDAAGWAHDHINSAYAKGFLPEELQAAYTQNITRGEFVRLAMSWLRYETKMTDAELLEQFAVAPDRTFVDTDDPIILAAGKLDITAGSGGGVFGVDETFNRQQAAVMLVKVHNILGVETDEAADADFADMDEAAGWARDAIHFVGSNGIMNGSGGNFMPEGTFTREQSIAVFNQMG